MAEAPTGIVTPAIEPITADYCWRDFPIKEVKGVRIYAASGRTECQVPKPLSSKHAQTKGVGDAFPLGVGDIFPLLTASKIYSGAGKSIQDALDAAIAEAQADGPFPDKLVSWALFSISGQDGGINGLHTFSATIRAWS